MRELDRSSVPAHDIAWRTNDATDDAATRRAPGPDRAATPPASGEPALAESGGASGAAATSGGPLAAASARADQQGDAHDGILVSHVATTAKPATGLHARGLGAGHGRAVRHASGDHSRRAGDPV